MIFFTADTHFFHKNILKLDNRPWDTIEEMNNAMLAKWNNKVGNDDTVYICGDYSWKIGEQHVEFLRQLHEKKILIVGNHDNLSVPRYRKLFDEVMPYTEIKVQLNTGEIKDVVLSHYMIPMYNGHHRSAIMLHGHTHNAQEHYEEVRFAKELNAKDIPCHAYNVGCMHWNYEPVTLEEIMKKELGYGL